MTNWVSLAVNDFSPGGYDSETSSMLGMLNATANLMANQLCLPTRTLKKMSTTPHTVVLPVDGRDTHCCLTNLIAGIIDVAYCIECVRQSSYQRS